jgi:hypothetical protein
MEKPSQPYFYKRICWDADSDKMDYTAKVFFIIKRVFERGDIKEICHCRRFYGDATIEEVLLNAKYLPDRGLYLASAVINKPLNAFSCYTLKQLSKIQLPH